MGLSLIAMMRRGGTKVLKPTRETLYSTLYNLDFNQTSQLHLEKLPFVVRTRPYIVCPHYHLGVLGIVDLQ